MHGNLIEGARRANLKVSARLPGLHWAFLNPNGPLCDFDVDARSRKQVTSQIASRIANRQIEANSKPLPLLHLAPETDAEPRRKQPERRLASDSECLCL